jgi:hypothetical protein
LLAMRAMTFCFVTIYFAHFASIWTRRKRAGDPLLAIAGLFSGVAVI